MYLVFGLGADEPVGSGNVAMYVMISMAAYGAVTATTQRRRERGDRAGDGLGPPARRSRRCGRSPSWPPRRASRWSVAAIPVSLIFAIGAATGARGNCVRLGARRGAVVWLGSALFAVYGLAICLVFRGPNAPGIASGMIVVHGVPRQRLHADERLHPRPRPLHAALRLRRAGPLPAHRGLPADGGGRDPLWLPVANVLAWTVIFALLALWGVRRSRART